MLLERLRAKAAERREREEAAYRHQLFLVFAAELVGGDVPSGQSHDDLIVICNNLGFWTESPKVVTGNQSSQRVVAWRIARHHGQRNAGDVRYTETPESSQGWDDSHTPGSLRKDLTELVADAERDVVAVLRPAVFDRCLDWYKPAQVRLDEKPLLVKLDLKTKKYEVIATRHRRR